ncbi:uncharacterized protein LOC109544682 isoform X2 [Dendroctonus ponderosae]
MDFKGAPKKRTTNFREDETKLLIQLWGSPTVQNRLYLTHRKAPVMRLIAANMEKHGFYRTPEEIKTRIRNLKCLYHKILKTKDNKGAPVGTDDLDWPHFKAMDDILSKKDALRQDLVYNHNLLSEVNAEVKKEFEQIDISEDYETNASSISNGSDDEFEENSSPLPATITPTIIEDDDKVLPIAELSPQPVATTSPASAAPPALFPRIKVAQNLQSKPPRLAPKTPNQKQNIQMPQIQAVHTVAPTLQTNAPTIPTQLQASISPNSIGKGNAMPFPLLILNGMQPGQNRTNGFSQKTIPINMNSNPSATAFNSDVCNILKEMLDIQKENLVIEKKRLEVETQKLDYERSVGHQFLSMFSTFQHLIPNGMNANCDTRQNTESESIDTKDFAEHPKFQNDNSSATKRPAEEPLSPLRSNKISKETVINGITKYMQECNVPSKETNSITVK